MKVLCVKQPWAWCIIHAGKDIENRTWHTPIRGRVLIAASARIRPYEYDDCAYYVRRNFPELMHRFPRREDLLTGGIIGEVEIVGCVAHHESKWFMGPYGFVMRDAKPVPFMKCRGHLGFWNLPEKKP